MKLLSCYVAGFGRMDHEEFDFKDGLNAILEENGSGKTTLSVFLKSMLYGLDYSPRTKKLSERTHYMPWDANAFGGSLTIETKKGIFRIERTFGKSNKEDTFKLIDTVTEMESDAYSENIGEEIFGLDRESFEKTVFVPQDALLTGMTDSINAKMGNLSNVRDDINNFDDALKKLDDAKKEYTRRSQNPGKLVKVREEIRAKKEMQEKLPDLRTAYDKQDMLLGERARSLYEMKNKKAELSEKIAVQSQKEQELGAYRQQKKNLAENIEKEEALRNLFKNGIPEKEEIEEKLEEERELRLDQSLLNQKKESLPDVDEEQRLREVFAHGVIPEEDILSFSADAERLKSLRISTEHAKMSQEDANTFQELKFYFSKKDPSEEELKSVQDEVVSLAVLSGQEQDLLSSRTKIEEELSDRKRKSSERGLDRKISSGTLLTILLAIILFAGAGAFYYISAGRTLSLILMGVCFAAGLIVLIIGLVLSSKQKKTAGSSIKESEERLSGIENRLKAIRAEKEDKETGVMEFLSNFLVSPSDSIQQMIAEIQRKSDLYHRLIEEENNLIKQSSGAFEELTELQLKLYTALHPYEKVYDADLYHDNSESELIKRLEEDRESYIALSETKKEMEVIRERIQKRQRSLTDFLMRFVFDDPDSSLLNHLNALLVSLEQLSSIRKAIEEEETQIKAFEEKHDVSEETEPVTELQEKQEECDKEITELNRIIEKERENMSDLSEEISNLEDLTDDIEALLELASEYERKVQLIESTYSYLQKAKEQFLSRYMAPLRRGLKKYLSLVYRNTDEDINVQGFTLDMDLSVKYNAQGRTFGDEYLSAGYRDLVSLAARMALIGVLYDKEQPMIFLDDPFTNLDEGKIQNAVSLLRDLSAERQIIYFTCHKSRMP